MDNTKIRQKMCAARLALPSSIQQQAAKKVCRRLLLQDHCLDSQHIAVYLAVNGELNLQPVIDEIWRLGKQCYVPVISDQLEHSLRFAHYHSGTQLIKNKYAILEPQDHRVHIPIADLDLVLTPLVAFDKQCNRLGMGGGYYDRTFDPKLMIGSKQPVLIGTGYAFQYIDILSVNQWDVPLNSVITEQQLYFS